MQDSTIIPKFIDSVNVVYNRQFSSQVIEIDSALDLIEASLNYSFSDIDTALTNHDTINYNINFSIQPNINNKYNFIDVANQTKRLANQIRSICNGTNLRLNVCRIDKINIQQGNLKLIIDIGEIEPNFNYNVAFAPRNINGEYLWRIDEYQFYSYVNCNEGQQNYAPKKLEEEINYYLRGVTLQRLKDVRLAAQPGYIVYYDNWQTVEEAGKTNFDYLDFLNLSKLDWPNGILSSHDFIGGCNPKSDEPEKSPIYAANPIKVACFLLFHPTMYGHKSCINSIGMNYYLKKSLNIIDALRPTSLNEMFHSMTVKYEEPVYQGEPLRHLYSFRTTKARTKLAGSVIL